MHGSSLSTARPLAPAAALLLGLAVLAGCGGPAAPSQPAPSDALARACQQVTGGAPWHGLLRVAGDRATLDAFDDYFAPSCLVVPAGRPVTLALTNRGHLPHTLGGPGLAVAASVDAGQTAFVALAPVQRATRLVCGLHADHQMVLAVVPSGGVPGDGVPAGPTTRDGDV